ncbi:MAG TPA: glycosyltransferase family 2 protein [Phycisphaerales bacterium]|nr:glycosyltransferase family 2 protein [Phycisphaerales bacterium]
MHISVLIPTFRRPAKLAACVRALAQQQTHVEFEVLVGLDGPCDESRHAARSAWDEASLDFGGRELRIIECDRAGYTLVRNRLVHEARGRIALNLNDDVIPEPALINAHRQEHTRRTRENLGPAIVVGDAPYLRRPAGELDSLLDRLVRETPMVFFYDAMNTPEALAQPDKDWGFRHCFGLNFSADLALIREVGAFLARPHVYGYDDIELAFKLARRFDTPVLYRPQARVWHDHFYTVAALMERERLLGRAAWTFAGENPGFGLAVFGRDIRSTEELAYSRDFVHRERTTADRIRDTIASLERVPSTAVPESAHEIIRALSQQHLLLKRWEWRTGLLEAAAA